MPILIPIKKSKFIVFLLFAIKPKHSMVAVTMEKVNASECQVDFDSHCPKILLAEKIRKPTS